MGDSDKIAAANLAETRSAQVNSLVTWSDIVLAKVKLGRMTYPHIGANNITMQDNTLLLLPRRRSLVIWQSTDEGDGHNTLDRIRLDETPNEGSSLPGDIGLRKGCIRT